MFPSEAAEGRSSPWGWAWCSDLLLGLTSHAFQSFVWVYFSPFTGLLDVLVGGSSLISFNKHQEKAFPTVSIYLLLEHMRFLNSEGKEELRWCTYGGCHILLGAGSEVWTPGGHLNSAVVLGLQWAQQTPISNYRWQHPCQKVLAREQGIVPWCAWEWASAGPCPTSRYSWTSTKGKPSCIAWNREIAQVKFKKLI